MNKKTLIGLSVVLGLAGISASAVESQPSLEMRVGKCSSVLDSLARLRCYDDLFAERVAKEISDGTAGGVVARESRPAPNDAQAPVASSEPLVPASKPPVLESAPSGDDQFGSERVTEAKLRREAPKNISSSIVKLSQKARGEYIFELANGQVWHQVEADRFRFRKDVKVEIFKSSFASYTLDAKGIGRTKVKRVK